MDITEMLDALREATPDEWADRVAPILAAHKEQADTIASLTSANESATAKIAEMTGAVEVSNQELTALKARNWDLMQAVGSDTSDSPDDPGDDGGYNGGIDALFESAN